MNRRVYENGTRVSRPNSNSNVYSNPNPSSSANSNSNPCSNPNSNPTMCCICWDQAPDIAFVPCGHVATCETCSSQLRDCPVCRQSITDKQKLYFV
jgi:E3 ubiquitin-protein ligase MUL1